MCRAFRPGEGHDEEENSQGEDTGEEGLEERAETEQAGRNTRFLGESLVSLGENVTA